MNERWRDCQRQMGKQKMRKRPQERSANAFSIYKKVMLWQTDQRSVPGGKKLLTKWGWRWLRLIGEWRGEKEKVQKLTVTTMDRRPVLSTGSRQLQEPEAEYLLKIITSWKRKYRICLLPDWNSKCVNTVQETTYRSIKKGFLEETQLLWEISAEQLP